MTYRRGRIRRAFVVAGLVAAMVGMAAAPAGAIVGGRTLSAASLSAGGQYGWLVRIDSGTGRCTGSLISTVWVLTAAHCVEADEPASDIDVFFGDLSPMAVSEVVHNPRVDVGIDLALLRLSEPVNRAPVALVGGVDELSTGELMTLAGWGFTSGSSEEPPTEPSEAMAAVTALTDSEITTDDAGIACQGDSGGPMLHRGTLAGTISFTDTNCSEFTGGIRVANELPWIREVTGIEQNQPPFARGGEVEATPGGTVEIVFDYGDPDGDPVRIVNVNLDALAGTLDIIECDGDVAPITCTFRVSSMASGTIAIRYAVSDGSAQTEGTWLVHFTAGDPVAPVATDSAVHVRMDRPELVPLLASDANGDPLSYAVLEGPRHGTLEDCGQNGCTYRPESGYLGPDAFTFTASDGEFVSNLATVSLEVVANRAPLAFNTTVTGPITGGTFALRAEDPDGDPLQAIVVSGPDEPELTCVETICTYSPADLSVGPVPFTFQVTDGLATSGVATVNFEILPSLPPEVESGGYVTTEDVPVVIEFDAVDPEMDPVTIAVKTGPEHGRLEDCVGTQCVYVPNSGFVGTDIIEWTAADGTSVSEVATLTIDVRAKSWSVRAITSSDDSDDLATSLGLGPVGDASYRGSLSAAGTFAGAGPALGIDSGIVLGTGDVVNAVGPNREGFTTTDHGLPGDPRLSVEAGVPTADAAVLEFVLTPATSPLVLSVVWASEEYPISVGTEFNDSAIVAVGGQPCRLAGGNAISIAGVNGGRDGGDGTNAELFRDQATGAIDTEFEGLTTVIDCAFVVEPGVPVPVVIGVADGTDGGGDSALFVQGAAPNPLTVSAGDDVSAREGAAVSIVGQAVGAGDVTTMWSHRAHGEIDPGATCVFADPTALATTVTCTDDGEFDLVLTARDGTTEVSATARVSVSNAAPGLGAVVAAVQGRSLIVTAPVADAADNDSLSCTIQVAGVEHEGVIAGDVCSLTLTFNPSNGRTVTVVLRDDDGGRAVSVVEARPKAKGRK